MTDETDTAIRVRALDREISFEDREALAEHVREILANRGAIFDPMELAAIQTLANVANGAAPEGVHRIARQTAFHGRETDADAARADTPFGGRIEELEAELAAREAEHGEARETLFALRREIVQAERAGDTQKVAWLRREIAQASENEQDANRAAVRVRAAWNAAKLAADRWRYEKAARYIFDGEVVTREELHKRLDRR